MIKIEYARGPGGLPQNYPSRDISTTFNLVLETQQVDLIICTNAVILKHRALFKDPQRESLSRDTQGHSGLEKNILLILSLLDKTQIVNFFLYFCLSTFSCSKSCRSKGSFSQLVDLEEPWGLKSTVDGRHSIQLPAQGHTHLMGNMTLWEGWSMEGMMLRQHLNRCGWG